ncbi:histidine kinase/DNA gyrase B/HSP90-like ATPase [Sphaerotilus hippei]|uniref:Histidine kinase/DNA gyrase B/HSP90-like ATPase n=1 Tax=Sphaerotilus hippei TaxID=744406 RepID=A0A318GZ94_9BURK|nr:sensor histidine kinase [Sphaerotilus hippei]PXW95468.1 histidine kinase/DNA gyrase B/HSP90-like ATPase [Sphaerotilus hippei]
MSPLPPARPNVAEAAAPDAGGWVAGADLTELQLTQAALLRTQADLRRWAAAQDSTQQNERWRIARELHDELQQTLAGMRLELAAMGERLVNAPADATSAVALLHHVSQLALTAMASTRRIVNDLRPPVLEDLGLAAALEALSDRFSRDTGIPCRLEAGDAWSPTEPLPLDLAHGLYRVAEEALDNVARHAGARQVDIRLRRDADRQLVMHIHDDGRGIAIEDWRKPDTFGLLGMHERVHALGGDLQVDSAPAAGTAIEVRLDVERRADPFSRERPQRPGDEAFDNLLGFLYRTPIGLLQTGLDGRIEMLNPMAANLLMPLSPDGRLDNLFQVLQGVAPQLRTRTQALQAASGVVCEGLRISVPGEPRGALTLSLLKQQGSRLMAVLSPEPSRP